MSDSQAKPDQDGRDHWLCPGCGTFDGPISYRRCDACEERPEVRAMVPASETDRLRAENERLTKAWQLQQNLLVEDVKDSERLREALREIEGSPRAGIGCPHQKIARLALQFDEIGASDA